jgi:hypothetical protein
MFDEIVKTLILGSSNTEELPKSIFNELRDLGYHINSEKEKTEQLLEALAVYAPLLKAASLLPKFTEKEFLRKHPAETLESCPEELSQLFIKVKAKEEFLLIVEFINLLLDNKWRISEELLPDLMDLGIKQKDFRKSISKIVGERGKWLVPFNPEWNYVLENELTLDFDFMTASRRERIIYFTEIRKTQANESIALLSEIWKEEDAQSKVEFLKCLEISLGNQDLKLLELAVKDSRKEVRAAALGLLMKIPESFIVISFQEILNEIVKVEVLDQGLKIITDVKTLDEKLHKIGIADNMEIGNEVKEAKSLAQLVSFVPINYWVEIRKIDFKTFLEASFQHQFRNSLFWGLAKSLQTFPNLEMMTELQRFLFKKPEHLNFSLDLKIFAAGPYEELFNKISIAYLNREKDLKQHMLQALLLKVRPWSDELSTKICSNLLALAEQNVLFDKYWVELLYFASYNMNPALAKPFHAHWKESSPSAWDRQLKLFFEVLELRNELRNFRQNQ